MGLFYEKCRSKEINLLLASKSPRRIEMLSSHGYDPVIITADVEENVPMEDGMTERVMYLALKKAQGAEAALSHSDIDLSKPAIIIAADTMVYKGEAMGKPANKDEGFKMLSKLRNTHHYVVTGVAVKVANRPIGRVFADVTIVHFKDYSDEELTSYLNTDEAYDKAGGYAIQGFFGKYIESIEGSYENVVGFPWSKIEEELDDLVHFI